MTFLLDVNALIALVHANHVSHLRVKRWFQKVGAEQWATCPLTEASFVRIVSNPKFSEHSIEIGEAMQMLGILWNLPGHQFWTMELSFNDAVSPVVERLFGHQQVTDAYLLGMAIKKNGRLVTLDKAIKTLAGTDYGAHVLVLE